MHPEKTRIVNARRQAYDVWIGPKGPTRSGVAHQSGNFSNPFGVRVFGIEGALARFRKYFKTRVETDPAFKASVESLKGLCLGCPCGAQATCHGQVYVDYLEKEESHDVEV